MRTTLVALVLAATCSLASSTVINYQIIDQIDSDVNSCVEKAMDILSEETCLRFTQDDEEPITFISSTTCAYQANNRTVHLNTDCISEEVCMQLIGAVLSVNQPRSHISRHLNMHYNCTDKCTIACHNGGTVEELDCSCKCGYGLGGESCDSLKRAATFTDNSCGVIKAQSSGSISLSTFPNSRLKSTYCQWLITSEDPWTVIEADIITLGLDDYLIAPGSVCNDVFSVFGADETVNPIPCDGSHNVTRINSNSNWLMFELRTNPFAEKDFTGPNIRYTLKKLQPGVRMYSEGMTSASSTLFISASLVLSFFAL